MMSDLISKAKLMNFISTRCHYRTDDPLGSYSSLFSVINDAPPPDDVDVHVLFCGEPGTDGSEIIGIFTSLDFAKQEKELWEQHHPSRDYYLWDYWLDMRGL